MNRTLKNVPAILLFFLLVGAGDAQTPPDEKSGDANQTGTISGQVFNDGGQVIANASVTVRSFGAAGYSRTTTTDSEGNFQVNGLEPLAYIVSASVPAYVTPPRDPDLNAGGYFRIGDTVRLQLVKGGVITGTITRASGAPVVGINVRANMIRDGFGKTPRYGSGYRETTTDDRGIYRIYGLQAGTYVVSAGGSGRSSPYAVDAFGTDAPTYSPSSTRDGATEIEVHPGDEISNVDIHYRAESGHAVSGTAIGVSAADQPTGFSITLTSTSNGVSLSNFTSFQNPGSPGFSFFGVADGEYDLTAQTLSASRDWMVSESRHIKVSGADITGIQLIAKPLASVAGHLVFEESRAVDCTGKRRPLFSETVISTWHNEKTTPKNEPLFIWGLGGTALPDKEGNFTLPNLAAGEYRFTTRPMAKYWYLKSISWPTPATTAAKGSVRIQSGDAARNWTSLKSGDRRTGLAITIAEGAASLRGRIGLDEGQKVPPRLFVYLIPAENESSNDVLRFFASLVAADGTFVFNNLPPGRYWAIAKKAPDTEADVFAKLRLPDEAEARTNLRHEAAEKKIEMELKPCQNLTDYNFQNK